MGLFDMILLKDNHIDLQAASARPSKEPKPISRQKARTFRSNAKCVRSKTSTKCSPQEAWTASCSDNFTPELTRQAVAKVAGRCETESSGGITLDTLREYAETGVDFISVGALTHQIKSLDMSLKAC